MCVLMIIETSAVLILRALSDMSFDFYKIEPIVAGELMCPSDPAGW